MANKKSAPKSDVLGLKSVGIMKRSKKFGKIGSASSRSVRAIPLKVNGPSSYLSKIQYSLNSSGLSPHEAECALKIWNPYYLTSVTLTNCSLINFPYQLIACVSLESLNLSHNHIERIDNTILIKFAKIVDLNLSHNKLRYLPIQLGFMRKVRSLNFGDNRLRYLPFSLPDCTKLKELILSNNRFTKFNLRILEILAEKLSELSVLDVSENPLEIRNQMDPPIIDFPTLLSLSANVVIRKAILVKNLPYWISKDLEDHIQKNSDWCCVCDRPYIRYNGSVYGQKFTLKTLAMTKTISSLTEVEGYEVICFFCHQNNKPKLKKSSFPFQQLGI